MMKKTLSGLPLISAIGFIMAISGCGDQSGQADVSEAAQPQPSDVQPVAAETAAAPQVKLPAKGKDCTVAACGAGTKVVSTGGKDDHYFACQTREITEYVSFVIGLVQLQAGITGSVPNISPETGEPEYEGKTKEMLDAMRSAAGVSTFDEAGARCVQGKPGLRFLVMNNPNDAGVIWVGNTSTNQALWFPKSYIKPQ